MMVRVVGVCDMQAILASNAADSFGNHNDGYDDYNYDGSSSRADSHRASDGGGGRGRDPNSHYASTSPESNRSLGGYV